MRKNLSEKKFINSFKLGDFGLSSIGIRLFLSIMAPVTIGLTGLGTLFYFNLEADKLHHLTAEADLKVREIDNELRNSEIFLKSLVVATINLQNNGVRSPSAYDQLVLSYMSARPKLITGFGVMQTPNGLVDRQWFGAYIEETQPNRGVKLPEDANYSLVELWQVDKYPELQYYTDAIKANKYFWSKPYINDTYPVPLVTFAGPIRDRNGNLIGIMNGDINIRDLNLNEQGNSNDAGYSVFVTQEGILLSYAPEPNKVSRLENIASVPSLKVVWEQIQYALAQGNSQGYLESNATQSYWIYQRVPSSQWVMLQSIPYDTVIKPALLLSCSLTFSVAITVAFVVMLFVRYLNRRMQPILDACDETLIEDDEQIRAKDEISRLSIAFFNMMDRQKHLFELRLKEESSRLLASVVESSDDAIITKTIEGIITSWNPAAERLFGYSEAEAIGQPISMLFPLDRLDEEPQLLVRLGRGERVENFETVRINKEGKSIDVSATISPLKNADGDVVGASIILRDISDRKAKDAKLLLANQELARATRLKDEFLANMSHELRTPLNAILGMSESMQEQILGSLTQEQKESLDIIASSGKHLLALISDILDVAKIESGQMEIDCSLTSIAEICQSSLPFVKQQALRKRIHLELKIAPNLPELFIDERRIRQALINLLNNAIKFTPERGRVSLVVSLQQNPAISTMHEITSEIRIAVTDTGIGISLKNMQKLFQPFVQIDGALNRQYEGTGLGLALVKSIVEMHNGTVSVTSEVGVGSCFTITLPCAIVPVSATLPLNHNTVIPLESNVDNGVADGLPTLLLAEDNDANRLTTSRYLKAKGYQLLFAKDGQEAINLARSMRPDLILMDIQMPNIDGLEAIKIIRRDKISELANIPIIALTGLAMTGDRERCIEAGANEYLTKPVKLNHLATIIKQILAEKQ